MTSSSMATRLVEAADILLKQGGNSTVFRRRAISTGYYAVFHALAKLCADYLTHQESRSNSSYERVYRALDHGTLKNIFRQSPLKDDDELSALGLIVVRLQAERHRADYLPPILKLFPIDEARQLVDRARQAVIEIEALQKDLAKTHLLATSLMFRNRSGG